MANDLRIDFDLVDRRRAASIVGERIGVAAQAALLLDRLRVRKDDPPRSLRRDREDAELEPTAALPLEQRWIVPRAGHPNDVGLGLRLRRRVLNGAIPDRLCLRALD